MRKRILDDAASHRRLLFPFLCSRGLTSSFDPEETSKKGINVCNSLIYVQVHISVYDVFDFVPFGIELTTLAKFFKNGEFADIEFKRRSILVVPERRIDEFASSFLVSWMAICGGRKSVHFQANFDCYPGCSGRDDGDEVAGIEIGSVEEIKRDGKQEKEKEK